MRYARIDTTKKYKTEYIVPQPRDPAHSDTTHREE